MTYKFNPFTGTFDEVDVSDLSGYVPYTGATANVDTGNYSITADKFIVTGQTDTDTHLDIDRTANPNVGSSGTHAQITETVEGTVFDLGGTTFKVNTDFDGGIMHTGHHGLHVNMDLTSGSSLGSTYPVYITADLGSTTTAPLITGILNLDSQTTTVAGKTAGIETSVKANRSNSIYGAWTQAFNVGTGDAVGYTGFGNNTSADTGHNATGVYGYVSSSNGLGVGVYANGFNYNSRHFSIFADGHIHSTKGNLYIYENTGLSEVENKTHINESSDGNLYVEKDVEVDGTIYGDGNIEVSDDLKVSGELQGARESFTFSYSRGGGARYAKIGERTPVAGQGYIMPRDGSIVSVTVTANVDNFASGGNMDAEARIAGTPLFQEVINVTGPGLYSGYNTQARGTDTFSAGNSLEAYIDIHGTFQVYDVVIVIEVQFDT